MTTPVTIIAPITLAKGKSEADLLAASNIFQTDFVNDQEGVIRRELIRKADGQYLDIVQFRSVEDARDVIKKEMVSPACHAFFSIMDLSDMDDLEMELYPSLATYTNNKVAS